MFCTRPTLTVLYTVTGRSVYSVCLSDISIFFIVISEMGQSEAGNSRLVYSRVLVRVRERQCEWKRRGSVCLPIGRSLLAFADVLVPSCTWTCCRWLVECLRVCVEKFIPVLFAVEPLNTG